MDGHCGGCLMRVNGVPNIRTCMERCSEGARLETQNAYPSAERDLLGAVDFVFSKGMNHHTLMTGSKFLNRMTQKIVRQLSGLGELPDAIASAPLLSQDRQVEVLVVGGGAAGLCAAIAAAEGGAQTLLVDEGLRLGGSLRGDPRFSEIAPELEGRAHAAGVEILAESCAIAHIPEERDSTTVITPERLLSIRAAATVHATGSYAQNALFENNDRPGVIAMRAAGLLLLEYGICPAESICLVGASDAADALAEALRAAGCQVTHIDNHRETIVAARGSQYVTGADLAGAQGPRELACQLIVIATTPSPASELARQQNAPVLFDKAAGGFAIVIDDEGRCGPGVFACGDVCGYMGPAAAMEHGERIGHRAARHATEARR